MNAHWVKWVSVVALAVAGTLGVACGDDDDDDNPGKSGSAGKAGTGGASGGGSGGSAGGVSGGGSGGSAGGVSGAGGAGGAAPRAPARGSAAALQSAIDGRKYTEEKSADPADGDKTKWSCIEQTAPGDKAHQAAVNPGNNRICANFKLAGLKFDDYKAKGWPTDAAAMKEVRDADGKIVEWAYYVKDEGADNWYWLKAKATGNKGAETIDLANVVVDDFSASTCEGCHATGNKEYVRAGDSVTRGAKMKTAPAPIP